MKNDRLILDISETMLMVAPVSLFKDNYNHPENRRTFFEIVCNKACLNPKNFTVMRAFEVAIKTSRKHGGKNDKNKV